MAGVLKGMAAILTGALAAQPVLAESFTGQAWVEGCMLDGEGAGCALSVPGGRLLIWDDGETPTELLDHLRMMEVGTALHIMGEIVEGGGGLQRVIVPGAIEVVEGDPLEPVIHALQGRWQGEVAGQGFTLTGADWQAEGPEGAQDYLASFGTACTDGRAIGAPGVTLLRLEDAEEGTPACFAAEITEDVLTLTDQGNGRTQVFRRPADQAFEGTGFFLGCDAEGDPVYCYVQSAGFTLAMAGDEVDPELWSRIEGFAHLQPLRIEGALRDMADASATLRPSLIEEDSANPHVAALTGLQGSWTPEATGGPLALVDIVDLDWLQTDADGTLWSAAISFANACPDGTLVGGTALVLYPHGMDPGQGRCWKLVAQSPDRIEIEDRSTALGRIALVRAAPEE